MSELRTVKWVNGHVRMIDQTKLPDKLTYLTIRDYRKMAGAISDMVVRGAPAIGVAAAMGLALAANRSRARTKEQLMRELGKAAELLRESRPTAWNLFWAIDRVLQMAEKASGTTAEVKRQIVKEACDMAEEEVSASHRIGEFGAGLLTDGDGVLTHCNAGTLATVSYGTALAPIRTAIRNGKKLRVFATETRPRLQGAKLTTFELIKDRIPVTLIVDGAAGYVMRNGMVSKVIVGADRITKEFVVNKVGTYMLALAAQANNVPFYVAAPFSTFHLEGDQSSVKIEERDADEVTHIGSKRIAARGVKVFNPAFDVTPIDLVKAFITEKGVVSPETLRASTTT
jgi:methylthioribose-1-phosphate isomerase